MRISGDPYSDALLRSFLGAAKLADMDGDVDLDIMGQDTYTRESKPWIYESLHADGRGDLKP
jgi:hypothetical protein